MEIFNTKLDTDLNLINNGYIFLKQFYEIDINTGSIMPNKVVANNLQKVREHDYITMIQNTNKAPTSIFIEKTEEEYKKQIITPETEFLHAYNFKKFGHFFKMQPILLLDPFYDMSPKNFYKQFSNSGLIYIPVDTLYYIVRDRIISSPSSISSVKDIDGLKKSLNGLEVSPNVIPNYIDGDWGKNSSLKNMSLTPLETYVEYPFNFFGKVFELYNEVTGNDNANSKTPFKSTIEDILKYGALLKPNEELKKLLDGWIGYLEEKHLDKSINVSTDIATINRNNAITVAGINNRAAHIALLPVLFPNLELEGTTKEQLNNLYQFMYQSAIKTEKTFDYNFVHNIVSKFDSIYEEYPHSKKLPLNKLLEGKFSILNSLDDELNIKRPFAKDVLQVKENLSKVFQQNKGRTVSLGMYQNVSLDVKEEYPEHLLMSLSNAGEGFQKLTAALNVYDYGYALDMRNATLVIKPYIVLQDTSIVFGDNENKLEKDVYEKVRQLNNKELYIRYMIYAEFNSILVKVVNKLRNEHTYDSVEIDTLEYYFLHYENKHFHEE